jgi:hypothetical protein
MRSLGYSVHNYGIYGMHEVATCIWIDGWLSTAQPLWRGNRVSTQPHTSYPEKKNETETQAYKEVVKQQTLPTCRKIGGVGTTTAPSGEAQIEQGPDLSAGIPIAAAQPQSIPRDVCMHARLVHTCTYLPSVQRQWYRNVLP